MSFPADLHTLVDKLAISKKKLANLQAEADKIPQAQEDFDRIRSELMRILDAAGFDETAVDLLLAAR